MNTVSQRNVPDLPTRLEEELEWKAQIVADWIGRQNIAGLYAEILQPWIRERLYEEARFQQMDLITLRKTLLDMAWDRFENAFRVREPSRAH